MMNNKSIRLGLAIGIIFLFTISSLTSMTFGYNVEVSDKETIAEDYNFDRYHYPESYSSEEYTFEIDARDDTSGLYVDLKDATESSIIEKEYPIQTVTCGGPMDSPWPMYCHDTRHTGCSPYSTVDTWDEKWRFKQDANDFVRGSPAVGDDGTIYFGAADFYALYPNGTLKWKYDDLDFYVWSAPAIDENGVLYVGDLHGYFYAINPDGTLKWKYMVEGDILSSPVIGSDGTIYFGNAVGYPLGGYINALYPNGTVKWRFPTNHVVYSSPAIGQDGTIYCSSHDTYLYALYPNNGILKWKYKTGDWIRVSPCIGYDGTIYVVSFDCNLHAVNPNGSLKWRTYLGEAGTSPTIDQDGTIYCGYRKLHAIYPNNGSVKWTFDVGGTIQGATPCHSSEDIIYFGTHLSDYDGGGDIVAMNPDGTERWRKCIANHYVDSAPAIGKDGTVYVGSAWEISGYSRGYLHAFGVGELEADADGPYFGLVDEPVQFEGSSKGGYSPHTYFWDFGDSHSSDEQNPTHTYTNPGNHTVTLTVTDNSSNTSSDTSWAWIQTSNDPPNRPTITGETNGNVGESYDYTFLTTDPDGSIIYYYIDWGDGSSSGWIGPYNSGQQMILSHSWSSRGIYNISAKAKDPYDAEGPWGYLEVEMPVNYQSSQSSQRFKSLMLFQILEKIMNYPLSGR